MTDLLSTVSLTLFTVAAVRELRVRFPRIDGLLVWLCAGLVGITTAFAAAVLLGPVDWRAAILRGLGFAVAAVGAVGTRKALTERAPAAAPVEAAPTLQGVEVPVTPENAGTPRDKRMDLDFNK